jgi:hypothetical protein
MILLLGVDLEGLMFDFNNGVVMHGEMVDQVGSDGVFNAMGRWYKPWYV